MPSLILPISNQKKLLSGIFLEQVVPPAEATDFFPVGTDWIFQEFVFPSDYVRGSEPNEQIIPEFTGFSILANIAEGYAETATIDWVVQRYQFGVGWTEEASGTCLGASADGDEVWFDAYFPNDVVVNVDSLEDKWRFGIRGRAASSGEPKDVVVPYSDGVAVIDGQEVYADLVHDRPFAIVYDGAEALLELRDDDQVYFSVQQGLNAVWFTAPNPLAFAGFARATEEDNEVPLQKDGADTSLIFRLLATIADEGVDYLGNTYRSALAKNPVSSIASIFGNENDRFWLSKPNPSRFAVECIYFDNRDSEGNPQVVDQVLVDPATPGVYFNIYYSNMGEAGTDDRTWEERLWQHVPKTYQTTKRDSHAFPEPVVASFLKIEFSHLQAKPYQPGDFEQAITYKKHPRWVLDYFLVRSQTDQYVGEGSKFTPRQIGLQYDALDLAYNYYLDDLNQEPASPVVIANNERQRIADVLHNVDTRELIDSETLAKITLSLRPFQEHPAFQDSGFLLSEVVRTDLANYSYEEADTPLPRYDVSALRSTKKDAIVWESTHPVMFFYLNCRHRYKEVQASLSHDRAYFVGIRQIAFSRERYTIAYDTPHYVETMGDSVNMDRNDFVRIAEGDYAVN